MIKQIIDAIVAKPRYQKKLGGEKIKAKWIGELKDVRALISPRNIYYFFRLKLE